MKRSTRQLAFGFGLVLAFGSLLRAAEADPTTHSFVGAEKCKMCHNSQAKGAQFTKWAGSRHARAYATLATEEAKKIGAVKGIPDPQKAPECLRCHVTGHCAPADRLVDKYKVGDGVSCESCHGPGGDYWKMDVMKNRSKATAAGLILPTESTCTTCHNAESPNFQGFAFAEMNATIAHPNPQKAAAR